MAKERITVSIADLKMNLLTADPDAVRRISERNMALLEIDSEHKYYKGNEEAIYTILISLVEESTPLSLKELKKHIRQATALAELKKTPEGAEVFKSAGNLLIKVERNETLEELEDKVETLKKALTASACC